MVYTVTFDSFTKISEQSGTIQVIKGGNVEMSNNTAFNNGIVLIPKHIHNFTGVDIYLRCVDENCTAEVRVVPFSVDAKGGGDTTIVYSDAAFTDTATTSSNGLMSAADKFKLDRIENGAQVNVIGTVKVNGTPLVPDSDTTVNINLSGFSPSTTTSSILKLGGVESTTEGVMWVESATELGDATFALGTAECAEGGIYIGSGGNRYSSLPLLIGTDAETIEGAIWTEV